ncbi:MAG: methyl-accepting chemotaxis protein [Elusimicrobia bacterium]|nr:methyl-accepting chemotaxis protein [Elusimicrobiota bacterium]
MTSKKRRQFWIDPPVQAHMLLTVMVLVTASVLLVSYSMARGLENAFAQSGQLYQPMSWCAMKMRLPMALSMTVSILASALVALLWSHRFAGPLRVLAASIERLKAGDFLGSVRVRDNDALREIVDEFSMMQSILRGRIATDRARAQTTSSKVAEVAEKLGKDHPARRELESIALEIKEICAGYRL